MNKPLKVRTKVGAGVLVLILLAMSVSAVTIKMGTDSSGNTYSNTLGDTADFIVYKDGSTYYSKNSSSGLVTSNSNATIIIQECIDTIDTDNSGTGGMIFIREGNYTINYKIVPTGNLTIQGCGKGTILYANDDVDIIYFQGNVFPDDRGFHIDKICFNSGSSVHTSASGIHLDRVHHFSITNCWFNGLYDGVKLWPILGDVDNGWIFGNHFYKISNYCISSGASCEENSIVGNIIDNYGGKRGISYTGDHSTITGNTIEEVWDTGIGSGVGDGMYITGDENTVTGNTIRECGRYALVINGANNVFSSNIITDGHGNNRAISLEGSGHILSDNSIIDNDGQGIYCISGNNLTISGNTILRNTYGISLNAVNDAIVSNNRILDSSTIGLSGGGQRYIITSNIIAGSGNEGIYTTCDNSTISFNIVLDNGQEGIQPTTGANNNVFIGNFLKGNTIGFHVYGFNNIIKDNDLRESTTPITINAAAGTTTVVCDNAGYVTENGGANASTVDGGTISHGLETTPTYVLVSGSVAGEMVSITALAASTFTVAIKDHVGNAGTSQTVYWRAFYEP